MPLPRLAGRLLVATPSLDDPNFHRTVVLVLAHTPAGALGIVLNRPSERDVGELVPGWDGLAASPGKMFLGGPVNLDSVIGLGRSAPDGDGGATSAFTEILPGVTTIDLHLDASTVGVSLQAVRLFAGSAGWDSTQLENEIAEGAWFVVDAEPDDVFTPDPGDLWRLVLRRQPGKLAWYANAVGDTRMN